MLFRAYSIKYSFLKLSHLFWKYKYNNVEYVTEIEKHLLEEKEGVGHRIQKEMQKQKEKAQ